MADREVKVTLRLAAQGYMSGMDAVAQKTAKTGTEIEKLAQKREAFQALGTGALAFGTAAGAGVALAISRFAEFDQQMSSVQAATHETSAGMGMLRDAALDAGASTVYSATEAASAIEELSKAGVSTADILAGGLAGSLDLAAAGQLGVARSAEITSTALNQFGLTGDRAAHVADVLAAGAGKAMGSVEDLAQGLKFVGPVAASMGISLEETTGVLALFAQQGIIGEQAGTSLRGMLSSLTSPSAAARAEIERLGITLYDSEGQFLGMQNAAGELSNAYTNMDGASRDASLGVIFGRETVTAATALYKAGAGGVAEWTAAVDDSGYAAETARARLDNLNGDLEALGGAFDTALIKTGSGANDVLREMVQGVTFLVGAYGDLPEPVQTSVLLIGAATAAVALSGGAALVAVPKWAELRATVSATGMSMSRIGLQGAGAGIALSALGAVIGAVIARQAAMSASTQEFADTLDDSTGAVTENTRAMIAKKLADQGVFEQASKAGVGQKELTDALYEGGDAARAVIDQFKAASFATGGFDIGLQDASRAVDDMNTQLGDSKTRHDDYRAAMEGSTEATADGVPVTVSAADAYLAASDGAGQLQSALDQLIESISAANGIGQDAISANIDYQNALAAVDETIAKAREGVEGYSLTLDTGTQAGRDNKDMLVDLASQAEAAAKAQFQLDGDTANYRATLEASRQALIDRATDLGYSGDEAGALADQILRIPSDTEWTVIAQTQEASQRAQDFKNLWESIKNRTISLTTLTIGGAALPSPGPMKDGYVFNQNEAGGLYEKAKPVAFEAGGMASGFYAGRASAIHKFAEKSLPWELYVSPKPEHRARNQELILEGGRRLGMWDSTPALQYAAAPMNARQWTHAPVSAAAAPIRTAEQPMVQVTHTGDNYSYDPTDVARAQTEQITRALDAYGIR